MYTLDITVFMKIIHYVAKMCVHLLVSAKSYFVLLT